MAQVRLHWFGGKCENYRIVIILSNAPPKKLTNDTCLDGTKRDKGISGILQPSRH